MPPIRLAAQPDAHGQAGVQVNVGKDGDEYKEIDDHLVDSSSGHGSDGGLRMVMPFWSEPSSAKPNSNASRPRSRRGWHSFPTALPRVRLMGGGTDGTGMPTSKGWEVEVDPR